jgi:hypothetical protein
MVEVERNNMYINIGGNNGTLRLPVSSLKQYMLRTFMFIHFVQAKFPFNHETNVPNYTVSCPRRHLYTHRLHNTNFCKTMLGLILHCLEFMTQQCEKYWATRLPLMKGK